MNDRLNLFLQFRQGPGVRVIISDVPIVCDELRQDLGSKPALCNTGVAQCSSLTDEVPVLVFPAVLVIPSQSPALCRVNVSDLFQNLPDFSLAPASLRSFLIPQALAVSDEPISQPIRTVGDRHSIPKPVDWIARPFVAAGCTTDVIGKVKTAGKTTFLTNMSAAVVSGKPFLGVVTGPSPVVYLTEQPWVSFREALRRANLLECEDFSFLMWGEAMKEPWGKVADAAVAECKKRNAKLLVVDTISPFAGLAGATENDAGHALAAMKPLQAATSAGIGVVIVQHERKGGGELVESGRGSTAFAGSVDILLSLSRRKGKGQRSLRELRAESRFDETPSSLLIELTTAGYISHGVVRPIADERARESILEILPNSKEQAMKLVELMTDCALSRTTAQKAVKTLLTEGLLHQTGKGRRKNPFRYWASEVASDVAE